MNSRVKETPLPSSFESLLAEQWAKWRQLQAAVVNALKKNRDIFVQEKRHRRKKITAKEC